LKRNLSDWVQSGWKLNYVLKSIGYQGDLGQLGMYM